MSLSLFVTDLDNTLVGDDLALTQLNQKLNYYRQSQGTKIVYATGRSLTLYRQLAETKKLLTPDALITSVGTEIYDIGNDFADSQWSERISQGWNRDLILSTSSQFIDLVLQPDSEQRPFKVSYLVSNEIAREVLPLLKNALDSQKLDVEIIYSGSKDLDILPKGVDKGKAVSFLSQRWNIESSQTVVCGDSGNDIALFQSNQEKGIIVGNAQNELLEWHYANPSHNRYLAKSYYAHGIIEGLKYFDFYE
jgi:sucrose-6F-phosphate phosphohydrolase